MCPKAELCKESCLPLRKRHQPWAGGCPSTGKAGLSPTGNRSLSPLLHSLIPLLLESE